MNNLKNANELNHQKKIHKSEGKNPRKNRRQENAEYVVEANQKAQNIVISFLEKGLSPQYVADKIRYITSENYEDVNVERAIAGLCGYPLCDKSLKQSFKDQTFIIRHNKVYDITERRNFCSNVCYEASNLVQNQIPATPLFLRSTDGAIENFALTVPDLTTLKGKYGKRFNIHGHSFDLEEEIPQKNSSKRKIGKSTKDSPMNSSLSEVTVNTSCSLVPETNSCTSSSETVSSIISSVGLPSTDNSSLNTNLENNFSEKLNLHDISYEDENGTLQKEEIVSKANEIKIVKHSEIAKNRKVDNPLLLIFEIEHAMREWMTFESLRIILGDLYVKGMLEELGKTWEDYDSTAGLRLGMESKSKYIALCKKLDLEESREKIKAATNNSDNVGEKILNPMPNYDQLQRHAQQQSLQVKAFYEGQEEYVNDKALENNLETIQEEDEKEENKVKWDFKKKKVRKSKVVKEEEELESGSLPLIDMYTQNTWRRQILHEKLRKPLSSLICDLGLNESEVRRLIKPLIASFDLSPNNISFKVVQWELIGVFILKMLCPRYSIIAESMAHGQGLDLVVTLLNGVGLDAQYLDRLLSYLTEITYILGKYHKETDANTYSLNNECAPVLNSGGRPVDKKEMSSVHNCNKRELSNTVSSEHSINTEIVEIINNISSNASEDLGKSNTSTYQLGKSSFHSEDPTKYTNFEELD